MCMCTYIYRVLLMVQAGTPKPTKGQLRFNHRKLEMIYVGSIADL